MPRLTMANTLGQRKAFLKSNGVRTLIVELDTKHHAIMVCLQTQTCPNILQTLTCSDLQAALKHWLLHGRMSFARQ
eukprot:m.82098 g.82098  ORF g.82098 m.82098 type:complete len:76 (-) comp14599_c0_seq1:798-1025(-)